MHQGPSSEHLLRMIASAESKFEAARKAALADRAEQAFAHNRRLRREGHDTYCNQMPRARGFRT